MTKSMAQTITASNHDDHRIAQTMGAQSTNFHLDFTQSVPEDLDDASLAKLAATFISEDLGYNAARDTTNPLHL